MTRWIAPVGLFLALVAADALTKAFFWTRASQTPPIIGGVLSFTHHENAGAIGNLPIPLWIIIAITTLAIFVVLYAIQRSRERADCAGMYALVFVLAGAIGNVWDRIARGFVYDWILLFNRSVINLADLWIALGLLYLIFRPRSRQKTTEKRPLDEPHKTS